MTTIQLNPIEIFEAQYFPHYLVNTVPSFHREWDKAFLDNSIRYLALEAGRGSAKTTKLSVINVLYLICEGEYPEIQTISQSGGVTGLSVRNMNKIKKELEENQLLISDYGIRRGKTWTQEHIEVYRGDGNKVDIYCRGKHSSIRGSRGLVIIDDPQDSDDCRSETVLVRDEDWLLSDVLPVLLENQRLIFIGTPISPLSLLSKVKDMPEFRVISSPAEDPVGSGKSAWPEQWSDKYLAERRSMMGLERYAAEYLCQPMVPGNPVFKREWFNYYEPDSAQWQKTRRDLSYIVVGFDGAESKSTQADYTAIVVIGATYGAKPDYYVLHVRRGHWTTKEGAEQLFLIFDSYHQHKTIVESRCAPPNEDAIIVEIRERERIYGKYINMYQIKPTKDKVTRAHEVQSMVQEGRVYFDRRDKEQIQLMNELTMFTGTQNYHDDCVDGFVYALKEFKTYRVDTIGPAEPALSRNW